MTFRIRQGRLACRNSTREREREGTTGESSNGPKRMTPIAHLGEGTALSNSDLIANLSVNEARGDVGAQLLVTLLETVVLLDVVKVVTAERAGSARDRR